MGLLHRETERAGDKENVREGRDREAVWREDTEEERRGWGTRGRGREGAMMLGSSRQGHPADGQGRE